jgi:hypothetical protein
MSNMFPEDHKQHACDVLGRVPFLLVQIGFIKGAGVRHLHLI